MRRTQHTGPRNSWPAVARFAVPGACLDSGTRERTIPAMRPPSRFTIKPSRRLAALLFVATLAAACAAPADTGPHPTDTQSLSRLLPSARDLGPPWTLEPGSQVTQIEPSPECPGPLLRSAELINARDGERLVATISPTCPQRDEVTLDEQYLDALARLYFQQLSLLEGVQVEAVTAQERPLFGLAVQAVDVSAALYGDERGELIPFQAVLLTRVHRGVTLSVTLDGYYTLFADDDVYRLARWMAARW